MICSVNSKDEEKFREWRKMNENGHLYLRKEWKSTTWILLVTPDEEKGRIESVKRKDYRHKETIVVKSSSTKTSNVRATKKTSILDIFGDKIEEFPLEALKKAKSTGD